MYCFGGNMPSRDTGDRGCKNLTLRLPDEYHRQVATQAARSGLTLNAHLINIVQRHLMDSGFAPDVLKSLSGRLFQIEAEPVSRQLHASGYFCSRFDVNEYHPLYIKRRAHYVFGIANSIAGDIEPYGVVKDIGRALLNFYNRKGLEIDQLAWQTRPTDPPSPSSTMKDNWRYIGTDIAGDPGAFMVSLARNHWRDDLLVSTGQSQDIRCNLRAEEDLYR
jgi:hypothetical protein